MIFVTVGSQLPFDRLIKTIDQWAIEHPEQVVFAQIGLSSYVPKAIDSMCSMTPSEFNNKLTTAELIVAHAGMGTIISALELGKPLLLMPRLAVQGEHRNDHQLATIKQITQKFPHIAIAYNESELHQKLENYRMQPQHNSPIIKQSLTVSPKLLEAIKLFIATGLS